MKAVRDILEVEGWLSVDDMAHLGLYLGKSNIPHRFDRMSYLLMNLHLDSGGEEFPPTRKDEPKEPTDRDPMVNRKQEWIESGKSYIKMEKDLWQYVNAEWAKKVEAGEVESLGPESDPAFFDEKRAALMGLIQREIKRLIRRKRLLQPILEKDREESCRRALIDSSPEGMRFQRYERAAENELRQCLKLLNRPDRPQKPDFEPERTSGSAGTWGGQSTHHYYSQGVPPSLQIKPSTRDLLVEAVLDMYTRVYESGPKVHPFRATPTPQAAAKPLPERKE